MPNNIHPSALIASGVKMGQNVTIEANVVICSDHVILGDDVIIKSFVYIDGYTTIGDGTIIYPFASIGTETQDLKFRGEKTFVKIGKRCRIRESVTINSSCGEGTSVEIGDDCLIMSSCHVAHHCHVGNHVILSGNAMLGGHVIVEDYAVVGGVAAIHQFCRIGQHSMLGASSRLTLDLPPYMLGGESPFKMGGINLTGLKRHGFSLKTRSELSKAFKILYRSGLHLEESLEKIENELEPIPEIKHLVQFCRESKRGIVGLKGISAKEQH